MDVFPRFPKHRLKDPKRQAELRVYRELADSDVEGVALYEARPNSQCKELDFATLIPGVGRYGCRSRAGTTAPRGRPDTWPPPAARSARAAPLKQACDSTMGLHDFLQEHIAGNRNPFIVLPDMEPDEGIEAWATQAGYT